MKRPVATLLLAALLSGCSTLSKWSSSILGGTDNAEPPAELTEIENPIPLKTLWSRDVGVGVDKQFVNLVPVVEDGRLYIADREGRVAALDALTGKELWEVETGAPISSGPGVGSDVLLLGTSDAEVMALNAEDGSLLWTAQVSSEVLAVPQVDIDKVIVQSADGNIVGLTLDGGEQQIGRAHV